MNAREVAAQAALWLTQAGAADVLLRLGGYVEHRQPYTCSKCGAEDLTHPFAACDSAEWVPVVRIKPRAQVLAEGTWDGWFFELAEKFEAEPVLIEWIDAATVHIWDAEQIPPVVIPK